MDGGAIHRNPITIVVPCHRVISADGSLTGFGSELPLKKSLPQIEAASAGASFIPSPTIITV
ncbi:MAG: methylated-DNA--[protein]-cysteine S-methyltransferase [Spirochaetaceae bacterium]|nr:methylated-DNA--[protein]-cysteine S-methyltransferase [Spirochaetaceae bacterium]